MDSANIVLVALTLWRFFSDSKAARSCTSVAIVLCGLFLLAKHHEEILGMAMGGLAAVGYLPALFTRSRGATRSATTPLELSSSFEELDEHTARPSSPDAEKQKTPHPSVRVRSSEMPIEVEPAAMPIVEDVLESINMNPHQFSDAAFQEVALLGKSSTRAMHKVRHTLTGAVYACKTVTPREMPVDQLRQALRPLRALKHVNLVRCLGIYGGEYGEGDLKVILEYHSGGNLGAIASRIKQAGGVIEENVTGRITEGVREYTSYLKCDYYLLIDTRTSQILQGLAHLHSLQILHRDIKPSNILLTSEGVVKLSEFVPAGESVNKIGDTFLSFVPYTAVGCNVFQLKPVLTSVFN